MRASTSNDKDPQGKRKRPWVRRLRRWSIEGALIVLVLTAVHWFKARPLAEGTAPAISGRDIRTLDQVTLSPPSQRPTLVHFWATWCPICKLEEGSIEALGKRHDVITVAMQSGTEQELSHYLSERALDLRVIADPSGQLARQWGVQAVPASFIVGSDGRIRFRRVGYTTGFGLRARLWLAEIGNPLDAAPRP
jgi:thiol-disulfide isomerase/thioredoxin